MKNGVQTSRLTLILSIVVFLFYFTTLYLFKNVYDYKITGAIFELLSLPILSMLVAIPLINLYLLFRYKNSPRKYILYSYIIIALTIGIIMIRDVRI